MMILRIPRAIYERVRVDLDRPHPVAAERIGFAFGASGAAGNDLFIFLNRYEPVADENYIDDPTVGARINSASIRRAMQIALNSKAACFHIHAHGGRGVPAPSRTDREEITPIVKSLCQLNPNRPHGFIILSNDNAVAYALSGSSAKPTPVSRISIVGFPLAVLER